jgi:hypothetical protein
MRWRDIRFERPTEAYASHDGEVLVAGKYGKATRAWDDFDAKLWPHWAPLSELPDPPDRIPDPPEGWRFVQPGEAFDSRCQVWDARLKQYRPRNYPQLGPMSHHVYIVPIAPPAPQYRPFANAAEFKPHRDKWWRVKTETEDACHPPHYYSDRHDWQRSFDTLVFEDGTPFGVRVDQ